MIIETLKGAVAFASKTPNPYLRYSSLASDTYAGQNVTPEGALALAAVYGAVSMISATNGAMPLETIDTKAPGGPVVVEGGFIAPMLKYQPNADMSGVDLWTLVNAHLLLRGNAYLVKVKDENGFVRELCPLNPANVHPYRTEDGTKAFRVSIYGSGGSLEYTFTDDVILHIKGQSFDDGIMGASPIAIMRNRIGVHLAQSEYQGRAYQDGMLLKGVLSTPQNNLSPEAATRMKQQWKSAYAGVANSHDIAVLHSGVTFQQVSMSPEDAQFIQQMKWGHTEIATAYSIPASRLNGEGTSLTYANQGQDDLYYYKQACFPRIRFIESALNMDKDLFGFQSSWTPKFNPDAVLRADIETRFKVYASGRGMGVFSVNDVRRSEDLPAVDGGDDYQPVSGGNTAQGPTAGSSGEAAQRSIDGAVSIREATVVDALREAGLFGSPPDVNVYVPEQPAPIVNVTVPDLDIPVVNVSVPEQPAPDITVNVAAPNVEVAAPNVEVAAPEVVIEPQQLSFEPNVVIEQPAGKVKFTRDAQGRIVTAETVEGA